MYKNIKIITWLLLASLVLSTNAANLENINVIDSKTIWVNSSDMVVFPNGDVTGEVKILRDIEVTYSSLDLTDSKKVLINLSSDLYTNSDYSLISVVWAEGNIDFTIEDSLNGEISNYYLNSGKNIEKINVLDSRTIEVYYNYDLTENEFEFKLLWDLSVKSLTSDGTSELTVNLNTSLETNRNYILMVISLEDENMQEIPLEESLYDFSTPWSLAESTNEQSSTEDLLQEVVEEVVTEEIQTVLDKKEEEENNGNIEEVSLNAAVTPETGPATILLIVLAMVFSIMFFINKKSKA